MLHISVLPFLGLDIFAVGKEKLYALKYNVKLVRESTQTT